MRREIDELRAALESRGFRTIENWEGLPAARAFIAEYGDWSRALIRLGFPAMNRLPPDRVHLYDEHVARVFGTPGVEAILKRDLARLDLEREAILARLCRIGLYGEDGESVRAATLLIRVCGWESRA
jgi:hypothetical protein